MEVQQRTITLEELQQIFSFLESKRVRHYDVQVELADHLATSIEEKWAEDPSLSLEAGLQAEYKKFGIFGFSKLIEKKQHELQKQARRHIHRLVLDWLNFPKIVASLALIIGLAQLLQHWTYSYYFFIGSVFVGLVIGFYGFIRQRIYMKRQHRPMLFLEAESTLGLIAMNVLILPVHILNIIDYSGETFNFWVAHLLAFIWWYFAVFSYELIMHCYPESRRKAEQMLAINEVALADQ